MLRQSAQNTSSSTPKVFVFHGRFGNEGGWSGTAHRKILIDRSQPETLEVAYSVDQDGLVTLDISGSDLLLDPEVHDKCGNGRKYRSDRRGR